MQDLVRALDQIYRDDLSAFIEKAFHAVSPGQSYRHNWHIDLLADRLAACADGRIKRLIVTLPPRGLKSIAASVAFPAWVLGRDPRRKVVTVSYNHDLADKLARDCRALMEKEFYRHAFPRTRLNPNKRGEREFETTQGGYRLSTSIGGTLTGRGGDLFIIDDPIKPGEVTSKAERDAVKQWYENTLYSRLDDKRNGVIVIVMQRVHLDDLVGHVIDKEDWEIVNLPAIAQEDEVHRTLDGQLIKHRKAGEALHPDREPVEILKGIERNIGSYLFSAQYLQNPVPESGNILRWEWFRFYDRLPAGGETYLVQSWDTATKGEEIHDYSVGTTWLVDGHDVYLKDLVREKLEYPALRRRVVDWHRLHKPRYLIIEDHGSGSSLIQDLKRDGIYAKPFRPQHDKVTRLHTQTDKIEGGAVHLPRKAPWLDAFKTECLQFPDGAHDDQVDSMVQFLMWLDERSKHTVSVTKLQRW
ncbi:MAG: phage terminase large subunit [Alphaproteobacteria bacterium]